MINPSHICTPHSCGGLQNAFTVWIALIVDVIDTNDYTACQKMQNGYISLIEINEKDFKQATTEQEPLVIEDIQQLQIKMTPLTGELDKLEYSLKLW